MRGGTGETLLGIYYELLRKAFEGEYFTRSIFQIQVKNIDIDQESQSKNLRFLSD
jgi:hypothetical protein